MYIIANFLKACYHIKKEADTVKIRGILNIVAALIIAGFGIYDKNILILAAAVIIAVVGVTLLIQSRKND